MKFSFDETELLNTLFENPESVTKDIAVEELKKTVPFTKEPEIIKKLDILIEKLKFLDEITFKKVFKDFPVDTFREY